MLFWFGVLSHGYRAVLDAISNKYDELAIALALVKHLRRWFVFQE